MVYAALVWVAWFFLENRIDPLFEATRQLAITFLICAVFWIYATLRYLYSRCPRCGYSFQQAGFIVWKVKPRRECIHCGLPFGAEPDNSPMP